MLKYKGYSGTVEYSAEDDSLFGKVVGIGSELHQRVDQKARKENTSINAIIKEAIDAYY